MFTDGESWNRMGQAALTLWNPYRSCSLAIDPVNPNILYAGTYHQNGLYRAPTET
jgi:hypothetical protein